MTLAPAGPARPAEPGRVGSSRPFSGRAFLSGRLAPSWLADGSVLLALAWWAGPMTSRVGGRGPGALSTGLLLLLPGLVLVRPWRRLVPYGAGLGRAGLALAGLGLAVVAAAGTVCLVDPSGWYGGNDAASFAYAVGLGLLVAGYLDTPGRRQLVAVVICLAGMSEFARAFVPWRGGGERPAMAMIGTFYWWNPYAAFLLPGAVLGLAAATWSVRSVRLLGWLATPLCAAGIVLSTSRAVLACLAAAVVAVGLLGLVAAPGAARVARLLRWIGALGLSALTLFALTGPPVFAHRSSPLSATAARSQGQSLASNGGYRLEFWHQAVTVARAHPVTGAGFHTLAAAGVQGTPAGWARSDLAHNGYLQAFSDGGLLLGLPLLALSGLIGAGLLRALLRTVRVGRLADDQDRWLVVGASVAGLGLLAHSGVDFDWSHPSDLALTGLVAALALTGLASAGPDRPPPGHRRERVARGLVATGLVLATLAGAGAALAWDRVGAEVVTAQAIADPTVRLAQLARYADHPWSDERVDRLILVTVLSPRLVLGPDQVRVARATVRRTVALAAQDRHLLILRARVEATVGDTGPARTDADRLLAAVGTNIKPYADGLAEIYVATGQPALARRLEAPLLRPAGDPGDGWPRAVLLARLFGPEDPLARCAAGFAMTVGPPPVGPGAPVLPTPLAGPGCDQAVAAALTGAVPR